MAFAMGGGYGHDIAETVQVQLGTYRIALEYWRRWQKLADSQAISSRSLATVAALPAVPNLPNAQSADGLSP
jgi:hypothetical protein